MAEPSVFIYVVQRDYGFAPNPFHGVLTLATCKPRIRDHAVVGDWVIGMGGTRLGAVGRLVFAMKVTRKLGFNEYWLDPEFVVKKPARNGSMTTMVGDNVYRRDAGGVWQQADCHHSNPDGTVNSVNLTRDTSVDAVLVSSTWYYFGRNAPMVPSGVLAKIGYKNVRGYRRFTQVEARPLLQWLEQCAGGQANRVCGDPFDFDDGDARYGGEGNTILR